MSDEVSGRIYTNTTRPRNEAGLIKERNTGRTGNGLDRQNRSETCPRRCLSPRRRKDCGAQEWTFIRSANGDSYLGALAKAVAQNPYQIKSILPSQLSMQLPKRKVPLQTWTRFPFLTLRGQRGFFAKTSVPDTVPPGWKVAATVPRKREQLRTTDSREGG